MARLTLVLLAAFALTIPLFPAPIDAEAQPAAYTNGERIGVAFGGIPDVRDDGIPDGSAFTTTVSNGAEPTILVDRLGRGILIGDHLGVLRSTNGGVTWTRLSIPWIPGNHPLVGGIYDGWALAQDDAGNIYASTTDGPVINVASSKDGGATWELTASTFVVDVSPRIADRPWLAAKGDGTVAMIWNDGGAAQACSLSTDGAFTFTKKTILGNVAPIGGLPAFDKAGTLVFMSNGGIGGGARTMYRYSGSACSGGVTSVDLGAAGAQLSTHTVADAAGMYTATPTANNGAMRLFGLTGMTLAGSKQLVVSPPALVGNTFGTIAARPGEMAVAWYGTPTPGDFTQPGFNGQWHVYVARVKDFWSAAPQVRVDQVTSVPNHVGDLCFNGTGCDLSGNGDRDLLDYMQVTYDTTGNVHLGYGHDGATANAEVRYAMLPVWT